MNHGAGRTGSPRSGDGATAAEAQRPGKTRISFNPKLFAANLSHVTFDSVSRWRRVMELPPAERTEGDIDHVDHLVGTSRFFSRLEESQRRELYRVATYEACAAGGWLFRQGDVGSFSRELAVHPCRVDAAHIVRWGTGNAFYIILVGQVDVIVSLVPEAGARGRSTRFDKHVATLGPLESFGEKALEDSDSLRKASIRAREAVELMRVDREGYTRVTANWRQRTAPHKIAFLRGTGFFPGWSDDQLFALAAKLNTETFDPGTRMVEEAGRKETVDCYFVRVGECEVMARFSRGVRGTERGTPATVRRRGRQQRRLDSGREECVTTLHKYDVFGHEALLLGSEVPNPHTIRAGTNVEVYVLKRDQLREILSEHSLGKALENRLRADLRARVAKGTTFLRDQRGREKWERFKQSVVAHHISPTVLQDGALRVSLQGLVSDRRLELATLQVVSPRLRLALEDSFLRCGFSPTEMRRTAAASTAVAQASHITAEGGPARRPRGGLLLAADDDKGEDSDEDYGDIRDKALDVGQGAIEHSLPARPSPGRRAHADGDSASMLTARVFETRYANREEHRGQRRKAGQQSRSRPQSGLGAALWARTRKGTAPSLSSAAPVREGEGQTYGLRPVLRAAASAPVLPPLRIHSGGGGGDHRSRRRR